MNFYLTKAKQGDGTLVCSIAREGQMSCYSSFIYEFLIRLSCILLIEQNNKNIGYVAFLILPLIRIAFILQIVVKPEYQGQQIGSITFQRLSRLFKRKHYIKSIYLHTLKEKAALWYQKRRFRTLIAIPGKIWVFYKNYRAKKKLKKQIKNNL